jgi:hypothetical protein
MPSRVTCEKQHFGGRCRDAAIEISQNGFLTPCKICGAPRHYFIRQHYPGIGETHEYELEKVVRVFSSEVAEKGYDPMIFLMRHKQFGTFAVWPFYWVKTNKGNWVVGQYPPILDLDEYKNSIQKLYEFITPS